MGCSLVSFHLPCNIVYIIMIKRVHQGPHAQYRSKFTCALYFFNVRDRNKKKNSKKKMNQKKEEKN